MKNIITLTIIFIISLNSEVSNAQDSIHFSKIYDYNHEWEAGGGILQLENGDYFLNYESRDLVAHDSSFYKKSLCLLLSKIGEVKYQNVFGKAGIDFYTGRFTALTKLKMNILITGTFSDSIGTYGIIRKCNLKGELLKDYIYYTDSNYDTRFLSLRTVSTGGFIVSGVRNSNMYLLRLDTGFNILWEKEFGKSNVDAANYAEEWEGGFVISGTSYENTFPNEAKFYVVKTDSNGNEIWSKLWNYRSKNLESSGSAQVMKNGNLIISGICKRTPVASGYLAEINPWGMIQWEKKYDGYDMGYVIEKEDGFIMCGSKDTANLAYLLKTDKKGNIIWERNYKYDKGRTNYLFGIAATQDGGYIMSGFTRDTLSDSKSKKDQDIWVVKVDSMGFSNSVDYVSIDEVFYPKLAVLGTPYPNPAMEQIHFPYHLPQGSHSAILSILDITGKVIQSKTLTQNEGTAIFDLKILKAGLYIYTLKLEQGNVLSGKFLKQ